MSNKPIFVATHPRACSTAFERVFMTRTDTLSCVHEPFGDAFYFGPERLSGRYEGDEHLQARVESGFQDSTYKTVFDRIESEGKEGERLFIKDIAHYLVPPRGAPAEIAPSIGGKTAKKGVGTNGTNGTANGKVNGVANGTTNGHSNGNTKSAPFPYGTETEPGNPTVVPAEILKQFHFTFLIRHPRYSIPSYWRCTVSPLDSITGFYNFMPCESGYDELRRLFDYLLALNHVGPTRAGEASSEQLRPGEVSITVIDADDLLDDPAGIIAAYCREVGIDYTPDMLVWGTEEQQARAREAFEKWKGFHEDAINSSALNARSAEHKSKKAKTREAEDEEWRTKYGENEAKTIRETVDANIPDYEYLKTFALRVAA